MTKAEAAISDYYDSLTDEERKDLLLWAHFAETQFPFDSVCELGDRDQEL